MINLFFEKKPKELSSKKQQELTDKFINEGTAVWREKWIVEALLKMSNGKCSFCECFLNKESNYMQVEHFRYKNKYPKLVVEWKNLLPVCGRCNFSKGTHDVELEPIIHPAINNPKDHLYLFGNRIKSKTQLGESTRQVLNLNSRFTQGDLITERSKIIDKIGENVDTLLEQTKTYIDNGRSTRRKNSIYNNLSRLLKEAGAEFHYSATAATTLLNDPDYHKIKAIFQESQLWDKELEELEQGAEFCRLERA